ncbi:MAG: DUF624 domain-containing protein [Micromonosporaceae bacterium]|jgi:uncharacterized membrane protein YesL|nr:DUF624 domain-containing protein [Micromonosporaceae bacterium]
MLVRHETYRTIFDAVYTALMANLLLVVGCLPLVAGVLLTDPARSWPLLCLVSPLCAPGLCAVFAVLAGFARDRTATAARTFARAWRASFRPAATLGALATATLVVLAVDARAAWGRPVGAVAIPVLAVLMLLVVATSLLALVVLSERPAVRLRDALRACVYLAVRYWYLTAASLFVLAVGEALLARRPALALGLAAAPLLYLVWANSRFTLRAALGPLPRPGTET